MKLLITGGRGLLGSEFLRAARERSWAVVAPSRAEMDVTDVSACVRVVGTESPDWVVHCAAFTAVDAAEEESGQAMRVNRDGSANVARAAAKAGAGMVHISTDYVFDGAKGSPYVPQDSMSPLGAYARSKVAAEEAVGAAGVDGDLAPQTTGAAQLIVRTGWLYGAGRRDFVDLVLGRKVTDEPLRIVDDQWGRPTWTRNVAESVLDLIVRGARGIVHVNDGGEATWYLFAQAILEESGSSGKVDRISSRDFDAAAERPLYSVLDFAATEFELGRSMVPWREVLRTYLNERGRSESSE